MDSYLVKTIKQNLTSKAVLFIIDLISFFLFYKYDHRIEIL